MSVRKWLQVCARKIPSPMRRSREAPIHARLFSDLSLSLERSSSSLSLERAQLENAIWGGFGNTAKEKLERIKIDPRQPQSEVAEAAWVLGRWYAAQGDYRRALENFTLRRLISPDVASQIRHLVLEIDMHLRLGQLDEGRAIIKTAMSRLGTLTQLCLCAANARMNNDFSSNCEGDQSRLQWLNAPLLAAGLAPLQLKKPALPLSLENISAASLAPDPSAYRAKVSVIMPAYNAEATIANAMASVLAQTWKNLELIAVDDGSADGTWSVIKSFADLDDRVAALRHQQNLGAYAARNAALAIATGEFVTVHDANDWSHPQKIALQALNLLGSDAPVNTTKIAIVHPDMTVRVKPTDGAVLIESIASVFLRRSRVLEMGGWDTVRFGADNEFYRRLLLLEGRSRSLVFPHVPLAFHLAREDSLSAQKDIGQKDIGLSTLTHGPRREYQDSYTHWHRSGQAHLGIPSDKRPFPIPNICKSGLAQRANYDILFVSDFTFPGGTTSSNINMFHAASRLGLSCGCFHWPRFLYAGSTINVKIRQSIHDELVQSVVAPESVQCKLIIAYQPMFLNHLPDRLPSVEAEHCILGINQTPMSRSNGGRELYCLDEAIETLHRAFGLMPFIAPVSPVVRKSLQATTTYKNFTELDWPGLIDLGAWRRDQSSWDNSELPHPRAAWPRLQQTSGPPIPLP